MLRTDIGYSPNLEGFLHEIAPVYVPYFANNLDAGIPGDLQRILASLPSATITTTPRDGRNLLGTPLAPVGAGVPGSGTGYPSYIGSIFVEWNGLGFGDVLLTNQQYSFTTTANTFGPVQTGGGAFTGFGAIPQPTCAALLGIALISLCGD